MADIGELKRTRAAKVQALREAGINPYPEKTPKHAAIAAVLHRFTDLQKKSQSVTVAGRIMSMRGHGGLKFMDVRDGSGQIQVLVSKKGLKNPNFGELKLFDLGDFVAVRGMVTKTKRGEKSIDTRNLTLLSKAVRPLPDAWYGLKDVDERFRDREVDFMLNPEAAETLRVRSRLYISLRKTLNAEDFLEVETPILQTVAGGATARPFKTKLNALDMQLYLRIAPELYLKRLVVGGFERVYELGRAFRNEGMDKTHNPEFTILEFYWAYQDLDGMMRFTEKLLREAVRGATGSTVVTYQGSKLNFGKKFPVYAYAKVLKKYSGFDVLTGTDKQLHTAAKKHGVVHTGVTRAQLIDHLFKKTAAPKLGGPCFVVGHPLALSPLAKRAEEDGLVRRMQVLAGGFEIVNAYAELNDPVDQRERFGLEQKRRKAGDDEAQRADDDFLRSLEYGLPPTAGFGLGVDRFLMLLTDTASVREVIAFPTMRPKKRT